VPVAPDIAGRTLRVQKSSFCRFSLDFGLIIAFLTFLSSITEVPALPYMRWSSQSITIAAQTNRVEPGAVATVT
jgi:hypothetical protein